MKKKLKDLWKSVLRHRSLLGETSRFRRRNKHQITDVPNMFFSYGLTETTGGVAVNDITEFRVGRTGGVLDT